MRLPKNSSIFLTVAFAVAGMANTADAALVISNAPTSNVSCASGACTATAGDAVLNVKALKKLLQSADLKVASGSAARDIAIDERVIWVSAHRLTVDARRSIFFNKPVVVAGTGGLTIVTDDGGGGGDFLFAGTGHAEFWDTSSSLRINGASFTLVRDIKTLAAAANANASGFYALAGDYDASIDGKYSAAPVAKIFGGTFEGLGNSISHFSINDPSNAIDTSDALFAQTDASGKIRDLSLRAVTAMGGIHGFLASLVGLNFGAIAHVKVQGLVHGVKGTDMIGGVISLNYGPVSDASFDGTVHGAGDMGGLVAWNYQSGTIENSHTSGAIQHAFQRSKGDPFVGGLAGASTGTIKASHSSSAVTSNIPQTTAGGLVGGNGGSITLSSATGNVSLKTTFGQVGGLAGYNAGLVDQSFATGAVVGGDRIAVGGLVGENEAGEIERSFSTGSATAGGFGYCGGLVGDNASVEIGQITTAYSTGHVTAGQEYLGGFVGYDDRGASTGAYWDLDTSGVSNPSNGAGNILNDTGVAGLTDAALKSALPSGFSASVWGQSAGLNNGYPYLLANPPPQ